MYIWHLGLNAICFVALFLKWNHLIQYIKHMKTKYSCAIEIYQMSDQNYINMLFFGTDIFRCNRIILHSTTKNKEIPSWKSSCKQVTYDKKNSKGIRKITTVGKYTILKMYMWLFIIKRYGRKKWILPFLLLEVKTFTCRDNMNNRNKHNGSFDSGITCHAIQSMYSESFFIMLGRVFLSFKHSFRIIQRYL